MTASPGVIRAIAMMCFGSLCFTLNDTMTKFLIDRYEVPVIILVRSILAMPLLAFMAFAIGRDRIRWSAHAPLYALRGAINLLAAYLYIHGLKYLSVAEATVILFASPFIITVASATVFREAVGWPKWIAVLVGFTGVMIAMRPGSAAFQPASLLILACAFLYASISLSARWLKPDDTIWTISFYGAAFSAVFIAPLAIGHGVAVQPGDIALFVGAALSSSFGIGFATLAYRSAQASDLAPFAYSGLIWSTAITWIVWGAMPSFWTLVGAGVVASSSLFHLISRSKAERTG
ncbi:DMT family transporter [Prosthecodimorpha staleyi]|uniref:DMT family transporter n=1 Tax=Prosthecodimorpha staleyi TaxID=2840188 RepID=A0A947DA28_9HYPH|nr:DMT family transporter [Prosthecodimorpha staleyi]MBT9289799.1 DMT family transporter [Prosthecodimorpha staleyi]